MDNCPACKSKRIRLFEESSNAYICDKCSLYFINPRPPLSLFENYYDIKYYENQLTDPIYQRNTQRLLKILSIKNSGTLIDIGCGNGVFIHLASKYFSVKGIETSYGAKDFINKKFGHEVIIKNLEEIETKEKYDVITMFHVLEHVYDVDGALKKCNAFLKDDGIFIIAVPNTTILSSIKGFFKRFTNSSMFPVLTKYQESHVNHFSDKSLDKIMDYHGFYLFKRDIDPILTKTKDSNYTHHDLFYSVCNSLNQLINRNLYYAILNIYKKK